MKNFVVISALCLLASCSNEPSRVSQDANAGNAAVRSDRPQDTAVHTTEGRPQRSGTSNTSGSGKWSASGDPIDTTKFDKAIADADKALKANPADESLKKAAAKAYFDRGFALTEARQYASAIGDYRRALKLDPTHEESQTWVDQIVGIYQMLKKEPPKPGEEPMPLPLQKPAP